MPRSLTAALLASLLLALASCGDDPAPPAETAVPEPPIEARDAADPRSVFLHWQRDVRAGRWEDAARASSPDIAAALRGAAGDSALAATFPRGVVEGVDCIVDGERATCLYGIEEGDRLRLDSAGLIRSGQGWVIERAATARKPEGHE